MDSYSLLMEVQRRLKNEEDKTVQLFLSDGSSISSELVSVSHDFVEVKRKEKVENRDKLPVTISTATIHRLYNTSAVIGVKLPHTWKPKQ